MLSGQQEVTLAAALSTLAQGDTRILAGGTDYYPGLNDAAPDHDLLDIRRVQGLDKIELEGDNWRIGSAVTWSSLIHTELPACFDALKCAAKEVGSVQIQNAATVVGNVCNASPAADGVPALLILNAQVELQSIEGRRVLPLNEFIAGVRSTLLKKTELATALLIPASIASDATAFDKLGARTYLVISIVMCATRLRVDAQNRISQAAIAVGACSAVASRMSELEKALVGQSCDVDALKNCVLDEHLLALTPIDDVRATASYRMQAAKVMLQRQLLALANARSFSANVGQAHE